MANTKIADLSNNQIDIFDELSEEEMTMITGGAFDYNTVYHTYSEIITELKALPSQYK